MKAHEMAQFVVRLNALKMSEKDQGPGFFEEWKKLSNKISCLQVFTGKAIIKNWDINMANVLMTLTEGKKEDAHELIRINLQHIPNFVAAGILACAIQMHDYPAPDDGQNDSSEKETEPDESSDESEFLVPDQPFGGE
ncbi:hypothetical protein ACFL2B_02060 [Patescibacteria group bacterium]